MGVAVAGVVGLAVGGARVADAGQIRAAAHHARAVLRAARVVDDRSLDLPMPLRGLIAAKLEKSGVSPLQTARIRGFVPIRRSDRASLYDESLPPGLVLGTGHDDAGG